MLTYPQRYQWWRTTFAKRLRHLYRYVARRGMVAWAALRRSALRMARQLPVPLSTFGRLRRICYREDAVCGTKNAKRGRKTRMYCAQLLLLAGDGSRGATAIRLRARRAFSRHLSRAPLHYTACLPILRAASTHLRH